jgi:hypothetical protein
MSEAKKPRITWQTSQDQRGRWNDECPNCGLFELVQFQATIERDGRVYTYEVEECMSCGWPNYFDDIEPDE